MTRTNLIDAPSTTGSTPRDVLLQALRDAELPVRVIDADRSEVVHLPIGQWTILDQTAVRALIEALGWRLDDSHSRHHDPDGCVLCVRRAS